MIGVLVSFRVDESGGFSVWFFKGSAMKKNFFFTVLLVGFCLSSSFVMAHESCVHESSEKIQKYEIIPVDPTQDQDALVLDTSEGVEPIYFVSDKTRAQLKKMDQKFCFFKYFTGCKYPYMIYGDEGAYQVTTLLGGTEQGGEYILAKKPEHLKNLVTLRSTVYGADANVKFDQIYKGYRETFLGTLVEDALDIATVLPAKKYAGTMLFDEYMQQIPMKWYLRDSTVFRALKFYMLAQFEKHGIVNPVQKPLLVVEFEKGNQTFSLEDVAFLSNFFELADPADSEIAAYFQARQDMLSEATKNFGSARQVGQTFGEMLMSNLEKPTDGFKKEVIALQALKWLVVGIVVGKYVWPAATKQFDEWTGKKKPEDLGQKLDRIAGILQANNRANG